MDIHYRLAPFVEEYDYLLTRGWYGRSPELQAKVESIVNKGLGSRIWARAPDFAAHLDIILAIEDERLEHQDDIGVGFSEPYLPDLPDNPILYDILAHHVPNYHYLLTRGWYGRSPELQAKVRTVVDQGYGLCIWTRSGEFNEHLDMLLGMAQERNSIARDKKIQQRLSSLDPFEELRPLSSLDERLRFYVNGYDFLLTQQWFTRNRPLQDKLQRIVNNGLGRMVNTRVPNLNTHLDDILRKDLESDEREIRENVEKRRSDEIERVRRINAERQRILAERQVIPDEQHVDENNHRKYLKYKTKYLKLLNSPK
jgi:hypothetical protein